MDRTILHCDMNNFYASVECMLNPKLKGHPVAVGGDVENRHGIILAKNYEAKKFGIQTGEALWQATKASASTASSNASRNSAPQEYRRVTWQSIT